MPPISGLRVARSLIDGATNLTIGDPVTNADVHGDATTCSGATGGHNDIATLMQMRMIVNCDSLRLSDNA